MTLAVFGWLGRPLSLGVITFLPIVIGIGSDFPAYLIHGGTPKRRIAVVALASAVGFASLALSPLPFVRDLGLFEKSKKSDASTGNAPDCRTFSPSKINTSGCFTIMLSPGNMS